MDRVLSSLLLLLLSFVCFISSAPTPWIIRPAQCGPYQNCVEIDFSLFPGNVTGEWSGFLDNFLLNVSVGGENGLSSCVPPEKDDQTCLFDPKYVRVNNGVLQLWVPGGVKPNDTIPSAQVIFADPTVKNSTYILSAYFEVQAKTSPIAGTCHGIYTQGNPGFPVLQDEQDIEILTGHYFTNSTLIAAGIQFTTWNPFPKNDSIPEKLVNIVKPFTFDPASGFYSYSIEWNKNVTIYSWGPNVYKNYVYSSQNPSIVAINNWSNGEKHWSEGPPLEDNILEVRKIKVYYNTK